MEAVEVESWGGRFSPEATRVCIYQIFHEDSNTTTLDEDGDVVMSEQFNGSAEAPVDNMAIEQVQAAAAAEGRSQPGEPTRRAGLSNTASSAAALIRIAI